ncbi:MAG: peptidoglycan-binding protein [Candidatus Pacebacteria bacterium]|nr:peptidoglycan-binding protein [Candidatus Paceibacterota bacterium]
MPNLDASEEGKIIMTISTYKKIAIPAVLAIAIAAMVLVLPNSARAAFDDVTLTSDIVLSVNGVTMNISGLNGVIESITVNPTNFTFDLVSGSEISISSANKNVMNSDASSTYLTTDVCGTSHSLLRHASTSDSVTITVTPSASTCSGTAQTSSSSSPVGGGGILSGGGDGRVSSSGGGSSSSSGSTTVTTATTPTITATTPTSFYNFTRSLDVGSKGDDVQELQKFLNANGFQVSASGAGSPGGETSFFGPATRAALAKYQAANGISPAVGYFGPLTRASFITGTTTTPAITTPSSSGVSAVFSSGLDVGQTSADIKRLQQLLNSDSDTRIASSGVGSVGNETNYFGSLTAAAVQKFQVKYGVAQAGDAGYGYVGPSTRAMLNTVFGGGSTPTPSTPASSTGVSALQAQINAALLQVQQLQAQLQNAQ